MIKDNEGLKKVKITISIMLLIIVLFVSNNVLTTKASEVTETGTIIVSGNCGKVVGDSDGSNLIWELDSDGTLTISGTGEMADYDGYRVSADETVPWNDYKTDINQLVIKEGITSIGSSAFEGCTEITGELTIPEGVTVISWNAFKDCSGFDGDLKIPQSVTLVCDYAFDGCSGFTGDLIIPESVTAIGESAFGGCKGLNGILTIPKNMTSISAYAFSGCSGLTGELVIPEGITSIGASAFAGCTGFIGELTIPESVTSIGDYAFSGCTGFTGQLTIPNGVTSLCGVFMNCTGFTGDLIIPNSITKIYEDSFRGCSGLNGELTIPDSVTHIYDCAFDGCSGLTGELTIPDSVTTIGEYAFRNCSNLEEKLIIPSTVTNVGESAFDGWKAVFIYCYKDSVAQEYATDYNLPYYLLDGTEEENIISGEDEDTIWSFNKTTGLLTLQSEGKMSDFYDIPWVAYINYITSAEIKDTCTSIGDYTFNGCVSLTTVEMPEGVTEIGYRAFEGCKSLKNIVIPASVTEIGSSAFKNSGLEKVEFSSGITNINSNVFEGCNNLQSVTLPQNLVAIGSNAFLECNSLDTITIPEGVNYIGENAFKGTALQEVVIPKTVYVIGTNAFSSITTLDKITIYGKYCNIASTFVLSNTDVHILGYKGSTAEIMATENKYDFVSLSGEGDEAYNGKFDSVIGNTYKIYDKWDDGSGLSIRAIEFKQDGIVEMEICGYVTDKEKADSSGVQITYDGVTYYSAWGGNMGLDYYLTNEEILVVKVGLDYKLNLNDNNNLVFTYVREGAGGHYGTYQVGEVFKCETSNAVEEGTEEEPKEDDTESKDDSKESCSHEYTEEITPAIIGQDGSIVKKCSKCDEVESTTSIAAPEKVTLSKEKVTYSGKSQKPTVVVADNKGNNISTDYYVVSYINNKNVGRATVTITFNGNYSGTISETFDIVPKGTKLSSLKKKKKGFTIRWKKQNKQTTGYQIQYSTNKKFKKAKTVTIKKNQTTSKAISKLKAKKKYYVRIRTYKNVKIDGKTTKFYSSWSPVKSVKTK